MTKQLRAAGNVLRLLVFIGVVASGFLCAAVETDRPEPAGELLIAAASDLRFALDELVRQFAHRYSTCVVKPVYGSSGNFHAQIMNAAPFDLFLSADAAYPTTLIAAGKGSPKDFFPYAIGRLVVWAPKSSKINVPDLGIKSLLDPSVKKITIANPEHAPYGRAAVAALKTYEMYDRVAPSLVLGENIAQTALFIESGNADIGIIALSLAISPKMKAHGQYWEIPSQAHPKLEQAGLVLANAKNPEAARAFRDFMMSARGRGVLQTYGFILPREDSSSRSSPR